MPIRRKRLLPKTATIRRTRYMLRRSRMPRKVRQPIQYFKRSTYLAGWTANQLAVDTFGNYYASLNQVPTVSDFTGLYDQFRINAVKFTLIPRGNSSDITPTGTSAAQSVGVFSVIDYDDDTNLTSISQAMQYQNCKMTRSHQVHSRYFKPRIESTVTTNTGTAAALNTRGWLDVAAGADVKHFGIKFILQQAPNAVQTFDLKVDYYLAFKCVR